MHTQRCSRFLIALTIGLVAVTGPARPAYSVYPNFVFNVFGTVSVSRFLNISSPAEDGKRVSPKDRIKVAANSRVNLRCKNTTVHSLSPGVHKVEDYCGKERTRRFGWRNSSRETFDPELPNLLSPRNTALLDGSHVVICWEPGPGATRYKVRIKGKGIDWTGETEYTALVYEGEVAFAPDYRYRIEVTGDNGKKAKAGMVVLSQTEVQRVATEVEQIRGLGLAPDMEAIGVALVYQGFEHSDPDWRSDALNKAALAALNEPIEAGTENSQIYLLQGDVYLEVGLPLLARTSYEQALVLAEAAGQLEWQAESLWGLAAVAEGLTEYDVAFRHFAAAVKVYEQLGDRETVEVLQAQIERLEQEI